MKKTKATIIQELLDKKHITVEEAMILMEKEPCYPTSVPATPYNPFYPGGIYTIGDTVTLKPKQ